MWTISARRNSRNDLSPRIFATEEIRSGKVSKSKVH